MIYFPKQKYPETATFIEEGISKTGKMKCNLDRNSAAERKEESFKEIPPKKGYRRAVWPLPICKEGSSEATVSYVISKEYEEAEKWLLNELEKLPDGTEAMFFLGGPPKIEINEAPLERK